MKSKPINVQASNPPTVLLEFGTLHKFDIEMDNGDKGVYQTNKYTDKDSADFPFKVGVECEYEYDLKYPVHPKIKLPKKDFNQSFQFNGKKDDVQLMICRQSSLKCATDILINNTDKVKADEVIKLAEYFTEWVMKPENKPEVTEPIAEVKPEPKVESKVEPKVVPELQEDDLPF